MKNFNLRLKYARYCIALVAFLLFSFSIQVFGQDGEYLVTQKGDTIFGRIVIRKDFVRVKQDKGKHDLPLYEVRKIWFQSNWTDEFNMLYAVRLPQDSAVFFLRRIEDGRINLYERSSHGSGMMMPTAGGGPRMMTGGTVQYWWYAEKEPGILVLVGQSGLFASRKEQRKKLAEMLLDQKELSEQFVAEQSNTEKVIRKYIVLYNKQP
ncbi:MAG: hypothetical protein EOP50_07830 [Sphingobacteriales bacterium]|nr:MAG: hypothetical protein EOP50_07830 [Sphingobacteriales bacterium]